MNKTITVKQAGQRGGVQRAKNLTPHERTAIARMGGFARQAKRKENNSVDTPKAKR